MGKADSVDIILKWVPLEMYIDILALNHFICFLVLNLSSFHLLTLSSDSGTWVICFLLLRWT